MCLGVYLAATRPLPLRDWDERRPSFNVTPLAAEEEPVRGRFSRPHVVYLGAYTGCSCGFTVDEEGEEEAAERSVAELVAYVRDAAAAGTVELFTCWDGDYLEPAARRLELAPDDLADPERWFDELTFATIRRAETADAPRDASGDAPHDAAHGGAPGAREGTDRRRVAS